MGSGITKLNREQEEDREYEVKGERRQKKLDKKRNTMRVNSRGLISQILPLIEKKGKQNKKSDFSKRRVTNRLIKTYTYQY